MVTELSLKWAFHIAWVIGTFPMVWWVFSWYEERTLKIILSALVYYAWLAIPFFFYTYIFRSVMGDVLFLQ